MPSSSFPSLDKILPAATKGSARPSAFMPREKPGMGAGIREPQSGIEKTLDYLARTEYASANAAREVLAGNIGGVPKAWIDGLLGKNRISFIDIAKDEFKLSTDPLINIKDYEYIPDVLENIVNALVSPAGIAGFAAGYFLDPLSWLSTFNLTKAGRLAELASAARKTGRPLLGAAESNAVVKMGSKLAREIEEEVARTGRLPLPIAETWAKQAKLGQRALLHMEPPWPLNELGINSVPIVRGQALFSGLSGLNDALRASPAINSARRFFSFAGIPPDMMDDIAEKNARLRETQITPFTKFDRNPVLAGIYNMGKKIVDQSDDPVEANLAMLRAVDGVTRITEEKFKTITRQVPIEQRFIGTAQFAVDAIDEASGKIPIDSVAQVELAAIRRGLGLQPNQKLASLVPLGPKQLESPEFPTMIRESLGITGFDQATPITEMAKRGDLLGIEWKSVRPDLPFNEQVFGPGVTRIMLDYDPGTPTILRYKTQIDKLLARKKKQGQLSPDDAERLKLLMRQSGKMDPSYDRMPWRVTGWRQRDGQWEMVGDHRFADLDDAYGEVLRPATLGRNPGEFQGTAAFMSDELIKASEEMARRQSWMQKMLAEQSRVANKIEEVARARAKDIKEERRWYTESSRDILQEIIDGGGIKPGELGTERVITGTVDRSTMGWIRDEGGKSYRSPKKIVTRKAPVRSERDVIDLIEEKANAAFSGHKLTPIKGLKNESGKTLEEVAEMLGLEPSIEDVAGIRGEAERILSDMLQEFDKYAAETPFMEARTMMAVEGNPDISRLSKINEALGRIGLRSYKGNKVKQEVKALAEGKKIRVPKEKQVKALTIPANRGLQQVETFAAEIEESVKWTELLPEFATLPIHLQEAALAHRKIMRDIAEGEMARGLLGSIREGYHPHIQLKNGDRIRWMFINRDNRPIQAPRNPFNRARRYDDTILALNDEMGKRVFMEDVIGATAIRGVAHARMVAQHDFITKVLRDHGKAIKDITKFDLEGLDPRFGIYLPKGALGFTPYTTIAEKAARRNLKAMTSAKSQAKALAMARETFQDPRLTYMQALKRQAQKNGKELIQLRPDELRTVYGITRKVPAYILPVEIADFLNRANHITQTPAGLAAAASMMQQLRRMWVPWTLFLFPSFFTRNYVGAFMNNLYMGLTDVKRYRWAKDIQDGKDFVLGVNDAGDNITSDMIRREAAKVGTLDAGHFTNEFAMSRGYSGAEIQMENELRQALTKGTKVPKDLMPGTEGMYQAIQHARKVAKAHSEKYGPHKILEYGMRVNSWIENNVRLALFIDRRMKGDTAELAGRAVRKAQFDYDEITAADRWIRTYLMPFYTYTRKNIPFQFEHLIKNPHDFANTGRAIRAIQASSNPELEILPMWMRESLPVRLGEDENERGSFQFFTLRNWLPAAEIQGAFSPVRTAMGMLSPWLRLPLERAFNYSFYWRRPIESFGGQRGTFLWMTLNRKDIELLSTMRFLTEIDRLFPPKPEYGTAAFRSEGFMDRLYASGFGFGKTFSVDMAKQARIARGQQKRLLREYTIALRRAQRRGDQQTVALLRDKIIEEKRRVPDVVLPLNITGLPTEP